MIRGGIRSDMKLWSIECKKGARERESRGDM